MRILVTGASGFVGAHLARDLALAGHSVFALGGATFPPARVQQVVSSFGKEDLTIQGGLDLILSRFRPQAVVHAAALANTSTCEFEPARARAVNVEATRYLTSSIRKILPGTLLLYLSTDLVFDGSVAGDGGFRETDNPSPRSVYGRTKAEAEALMLEAGGYVIRSCLVYGVAIGEKEGFLGWMRKALVAGKPVTLATNEYRTPIFSGDIAALLKVLAETQPRNEHMFHAAGAERISRYEFGLRYCSAFGYNKDLLVAVKQEEIKTGAPRSPDVSLSSIRTSTLLTWKTRDVISGLAAMKNEN